MKSLINIAREEQEDGDGRVLLWNDQKNSSDLKDLVYVSQIDGAKAVNARFENQFFENKKPVCKKKVHQRQLTVVKENTNEETIGTKQNTTRSGYETDFSADKSLQKQDVKLIQSVPNKKVDEQKKRSGTPNIIPEKKTLKQTIDKDSEQSQKQLVLNFENK